MFSKLNLQNLGVSALNVDCHFYINHYLCLVIRQLSLNPVTRAGRSVLSHADSFDLLHVAVSEATAHFDMSDFPWRRKDDVYDRFNRRISWIIALRTPRV